MRFHPIPPRPAPARRAGAVLAGWLCAAALLAPRAAPAQEDPAALADPGFATLAYLAETDPDAALDRISAMLDRIEVTGQGDPRVVFDLYRLAADLMIEGGQVEQAALILARLARFAQQFRPRLDIDPAPIFAEAAALLEDTGQFRAAAETLLALIEEQRAGARPAPVIADTRAALARVRAALGEPPPPLAPQLPLTPQPPDPGRPPEMTDMQDMPGAPAGSGAPGGLTGGGPGGGGHHRVDVYYATDRARSGRREPALFYGSGRGALELGVATVTLPERHSPGVVERPSIWRLEFRADPARHVVLQEVQPLDPDGFYARLGAEFAATPTREAFVFVHGYNMRFDQAARRAAQIAHDMTYAGVPILYSWPSRGSTIGYVADTAVVRLSGRRLARFLDDLVARSGAQTIHLVAHSMGNRALTDALELMALRRGQRPGDPPVFGQILFAAPDLDAGLFREMLPTIRPLARRLTLYASERDWALVAARKLHGNALRAGMGGPYTLSDPAVDSIDMSELGEDMLAHSYFADDSSALADMMTLFWRNADPAMRCGLTATDPPEDGPPIWRYRPGPCAERQLIEVLAHLRAENVASLEAARQVVGRTVTDAALQRQLDPVIERLLGD